MQNLSCVLLFNQNDKIRIKIYNKYIIRIYFYKIFLLFSLNDLLFKNALPNKKLSLLIFFKKSLLIFTYNFKKMILKKTVALY